MEHNFYYGGDFARVPAEKLEKLKSYGACVVADAMKGFNSMDSRIHSIQLGTTVCGCAFTVRLRPADNLMLHRAIELFEPGDILVVDTCCSYRNAPIGGIMTGAAFGRGLGGLVIDGAVRDIEELRENNYPIFAAAIVPNTGDNDTPGMINRPISCGNVPVLPGDVILGDDNGVVVVPQADLDWVLENCEKKLAAEKQRVAEIKNGQLTAQRLRDKLDKLGLL